MEAETPTPADAPPTDAPPTRYFPPAQSCGGLVAAVGILLLTGMGALSTLPGSPVAALYPAWLTWTLRLAPLPVLILLWAVVSEAEFKIRTDPTAICFRRGLGAVTRVPWRELQDFFADCGRSLQQVADSGGSMVEGTGSVGQGTASAEEPNVGARFIAPDQVGAPFMAPTDAPPPPPARTEPRPEAPFADYRPDHMLVSERGLFVLNDIVSHLAVLTREVVAHAPANAPSRWEEASWLTCGACRERFAASLWPPSGEADLPESGACPHCAAPLDDVLAEITGPFIVELRSAERRRFVWRARVAPAVEEVAEIVPPPAEAPADEGDTEAPSETG